MSRKSTKRHWSESTTSILKKSPVNHESTRRLIGNPVCNAQVEEKSYCMPEVDARGYSTVSECVNECPHGRGKRPRTCDCAHPYAGKLIFRGPLFRNVKNATRFQRLEKDLKEKLKLGEDTVSLLDPSFDNDDGYLVVSLELFPSDGDSFSRTEIQRLGSALSTQVYKPHDDEWGPYIFMGEIYAFDSKKRNSSSFFYSSFFEKSIHEGLQLQTAISDRYPPQRSQELPSEPASSSPHW